MPSLGAAPPPNLILMHSHNTGPYVEPYGFRVATPALSRLAAEGVLFRHAFAAAPTCSPSRAAFLTGSYPHEVGVMGLATRGWGLSRPERHLARTLGQAGFETVLAGVEHTTAWQKRGVDGVGYNRVLLDQESRCYAREVGPAVESFLQSAPTEPFFMSVGTDETHLPYPQPEPDRYPTEDARYQAGARPLPDRPRVRETTAGLCASARLMDDCWGRILTTLDDTCLPKRTIVCSFSDHGLQQPRNMCNLTSHGLQVYLIVRGPDQSNDEAAAPVARGRGVDVPVSLLDIAPTLCDFADLPRQPWFRGRSLMPLLAGGHGSVDTAQGSDDPSTGAAKHGGGQGYTGRVLFGESTHHAAYEPQRCVFDDRFTYIRRFDDRQTVTLPNCNDSPAKAELVDQGWGRQLVARETLYDRALDPDQTRNRIADPAFADRAARMRGLLHDWMVDTTDPLLDGPIRPDGGQRVTDADTPDPAGPTVPGITSSYLGWGDTDVTAVSGGKR